MMFYGAIMLAIATVSAIYNVYSVALGGLTLILAIAGSAMFLIGYSRKVGK